MRASLSSVAPMGVVLYGVQNVSVAAFNIVCALYAGLDSSSPSGAMVPQNNALLAKFRFDMLQFEDSNLQSATITLDSSNKGSVQNVKLVSASGQVLGTVASLSSGSPQKIQLTSPLTIPSGSFVILQVRGDTIGLQGSSGTPNAAVVTLTNFEATSLRSGIQQRLSTTPIHGNTLIF